jgi:hypothetical protein
MSMGIEEKVGEFKAELIKDIGKTAKEQEQELDYERSRNYLHNQ